MAAVQTAPTASGNAMAEARQVDGTMPPRHQATRSSLRAAVASSPARGTNTTNAQTNEAKASASASASAESFPSISSSFDSLSLRVDPDAQATVTDFLDFTEYLPSDIVRSLTLIGKLDQDYVDASTKTHSLTSLWSRLPTMAPDARPAPAQLRADISSSLNYGLSSRIYAHAEAVRMAENVSRHYHRAKTILSKLQTMLENYPEAEQQEQEQQQQRQQQQRDQEQQQQQQQQQQHQQKQQQQKSSGAGGRGQKSSTGVARVHRQRVPRITVPGEVLAPYELEYDMFSDESDVSSSSSADETPVPMRRKSTPGAQARMKMNKALAGAASGASNAAAAGAFGLASATPKTPKVRGPRGPRVAGLPYLSTSSALAQLKPPPENAVVGSADAPWLQLTQYELARLRKRMKKNAQWTPSETMIARELKSLGRHLEAFNEAKKRAEEDGQPFEGSLPVTVMEADGVERAPPGALSVDAAIAAADRQLTNRGIKLNEAKRLKNNLGQLAAQEAEESTRKMLEKARALLSPYPQTGPSNATAAATPTSTSTSTPMPTADQGLARGAGNRAAARSTTPMSRKRKRDTAPPESVVGDGAEREGDGSSAEASTGTPNTMVTASASQRQPPKRVKTETPVPIPQHAANSVGSVPPYETMVHPPLVRHSTTPVPVPAPVGGQDQSIVAAAKQSSSMSPLSTGSNLSSVATVTTTIPLKPPGETPIPPPVHSPKKSTTPIHPPVRELRARESARKDLQQLEKGADEPEIRAPSRAASRAGTPARSATEPTVTAPALSVPAGRRPMSRGASIGAVGGGGQQPPLQTLASERPRRASTVHTTPVPDAAAGAAAAAATTAAATAAAAAARVPSKRVKRPAPGIVSRTSSGGSAAVGRRKAAPRKKKRGPKRELPLEEAEEERLEAEIEVEVDDEGNLIDPEEARYCVCNRVSFGTMIQCENVENCKQEWFHLECVELTAVPARTTKWYCPDCRVLLNIGQKGEVSARGVRM